MNEYLLYFCHIKLVVFIQCFIAILAVINCYQLFFINFNILAFDKQEMSYYDPIYYPYFSSRTVPAPLPLLEEQLVRQKLQITARMRQQQELARLERLKEYQEEVRARQRMDKVVAEEIQYQRNQQMLDKARLQEELHLTYLQKIDRIKRERRILDFEAEAHLKDSLYLQDQLLLQSYQQGKRARQYQQQLRRQQELDQNINQARKRSILNGYVEDERFMRERQREKLAKKQNQVPQIQKFESQQHTLRKKLDEEENKYSAAKRSYIDDLKSKEDAFFSNDAINRTLTKNQNVIVNKNPKSNTLHKDINGTSKRQKIYSRGVHDKLKPKGETVSFDLTKSQFDPSPLKIRYLKQSKRKQNPYLKRSNTKKGKNNRSIANKKKSKSLIQKSQRSQLNQQPLQRSRMDQLAQAALKKIQNRLKLSAIIYKDSEWRHTKHELNHLFNTYENQIKIRQQIKDKINTHPKILRKHAMVVEESK